MAFDELRFAHIVRDLAVNPADYKATLQKTVPARQLYVVMFTARSGSTWLTHLLSSTNLLGHPEEFINPDFIRDVAVFLHAREPAKFLTALTRRRQTSNGIFGIEARSIDLHMFGKDDFFEFFDQSTLFFNLWRDNIVAQALSLYRAVATKRYHSNDGQPQATPPPYDAQAITDWLLHLAEVENENIRLMRIYRRPFSNICYETIIAGRNATLKFFADRLNVVLPPEIYAAPGQDELQKIGDSWNVELEARYRDEHAAFLAGIESRRLVKQSPV
jgi:LPS sulfotransferase NodH